MSTAPIIKRARAVYGNKLVLRDVTVDDAQFILSLRLDPEKSAYISPVSADINKQVEWIENYFTSTGQAYFIICDPDENRIGTVRLYNAIGNSFSWGSWILKDNSPFYAAAESAQIVYKYGLEYLGFTAAHFEVNRQNKSVWAFHERFGARRIKETDEEYFYEISSEAIQASFARYVKFLPKPIRVEVS